MKRRDILFLKGLAEELEARKCPEGSALLGKMLTEADQSYDYKQQLLAWIDIGGHPNSGTTLALRTLAEAFGKYSHLNHANAVDAIEAASIPAREGVPCTKRTLEGRLFAPRVWDSGWQLSLQADKAGYQCSPAKRFDRLESYDTVEAAIYKDDLMVVDPHTLDLPNDLVAKFTSLDPGGGPAIGCHLTWDDIEILGHALNQAGPNAGVPRGNIGWNQSIIWHGTNHEAGEDILAHGVRVSASSRGYFGPAFYAASEEGLASSNYAEAFDDEPGVLVKLYFDEGANVLDLRNAEDAKKWAPWGKQVNDPAFDRLMRKAGIDAVYDRSIGGFAIYRADAVQVIGLERPHLDTKAPCNDGPSGMG